MKILLTGATGMLGAYILYHLLKQGNEVRAIKRSTADLTTVEAVFAFLNQKEANPILLNNNLLEWMEGDLQDFCTLLDGIQGVEAIYHNAALVSYNPKDEDRIFEVNLNATATLVDLAIEHQVPYFHHVSSVAALDRQKGKTTNEDAANFIRNFSSAYAKSKYLAELEVWRGYAEGLSGVIINPGVILGIGRYQSGSGKLFSSVNDGMPFYPKGANAYVDAEDVAKTFLKLADDPQYHHNRYVCVAEHHPHRKVLTLIAETLGKKPPGIQAPLYGAYALAAWQRLKHSLFGSDVVITPELARSSSKVHTYHNQKLKKAIAYDFKPIAQSIAEIGQHFRKLHS